jgi:diguanylate cyclase (GGDEF)-like protein
MHSDADKYRISRWLAEFANRDTELAFQKYIQPTIARQLRIALIVWASILLLFAVPDYIVLGLTKPFYYLMAYRIVIVVALLILIFVITPQTNIFKISYPVTLVALAGFSGFMLFFIYRPDVVDLVMGVLALQVIGLLMFVPIRFTMSFSAALYGVFITLLTRYVLGTPGIRLISQFVVFMLPVVVGAATAIRLGILQRREYAQLTKTRKINLELKSEIERRQKLEAVLKELATIDPLTGLYNRREYEILFQHEMERSKRMNSPLSVGIIDLDHFKQVNDTYGHKAGDEVLRRISALCRENLRTMDIIGRLGGEEFIILLPETTIDRAVMVGNRLLKALAATDIDVGTASIKITATLGITQLLPDDKEIDIITRRADDALYKGKEAGRNRVEINMA